MAILHLEVCVNRYRNTVLVNVHPFKKYTFVPKGCKLVPQMYILVLQRYIMELQRSNMYRNGTYQDLFKGYHPSDSVCTFISDSVEGHQKISYIFFNTMHSIHTIYCKKRRDIVVCYSECHLYVLDCLVLFTFLSGRIIGVKFYIADCGQHQIFLHTKNKKMNDTSSYVKPFVNKLAFS